MTEYLAMRKGGKDCDFLYCLISLSKTQELELAERQLTRFQVFILLLLMSCIVFVFKEVA